MTMLQQENKKKLKLSMTDTKQKLFKSQIKGSVLELIFHYKLIVLLETKFKREYKKILFYISFETFCSFVLQNFFSDNLY